VMVGAVIVLFLLIARLVSGAGAARRG
jgi:hypothetical protein